jgi:hypothetical protein
MTMDTDTKRPKTEAEGKAAATAMEAAWKAAETEKAAEIEAARKATAEDFVNMSQQQIASIMEVQKEITACCEQTVRGWADRIKLEFDLASAFATKLRGAKSVPESGHIYQEWLGHRMKLSADEGQELMGDFQRFLNASARAMSSSVRAKT